MNFRRSHRLALCLVALLGCRRDGGTEPVTHPPDAKHHAVTPATVAQLAKLADAIDPGEQRPLFEGAPQVVVEVAGLATAVDASALEAPLEAWDTMPPSATAAMRTAAIIQLAHVLLGAESARVKDEHDRVVRLRALERLYAFFDLPMFANDRSFFASTFSQAARIAAAGKSPDADQARTTELVSFAFDAMKRSAALHRHAAAVLMREHPGDRHIPDVLDRLAGSVGGDQPELAVELRKLGVELRAAYVTVPQLLDAAQACYVAFDAACGDAMLARAKSHARNPDETLTKHFAATETIREQAAKVSANDKATELEPRLERARLLIELGRRRDAATAITQMLADFPDDARVVTLAARRVLTDAFDLEGAYQIIASAPAKLQHRDRDYLEAAIGLRATHFAYEVMPRAQGGIGAVMAALGPEYAVLRADVLEYEASGADLGKVLHAIMELGEGALPFADGKDERKLMSYARGQLGKGIALVAAAPNSLEAWRLAAGLALLSDDRAKVLAFTDRSLPADPSGAIALQHVQLQVAVAVAWSEPARLAAAEHQLTGLPHTLAADARALAFADLDAVLWKLKHDANARDRGIAIYRELLIAEGDKPDARMLDNLAVLIADAGDAKEAERLWQLVVDKNSDTAEYARVALAGRRGSPADVTTLEAIAKAGSNEGRIAATHWLVALAKTPADRKRRQGEQRKLLAELHARAPKLPLLPAADGVSLVGTLNVGVGYNATTGMQVSIETLRLPHLVWLPAAVD